MPPKKSYATFGSTTITLPPQMIGYDRKHHPHLWNTITPVKHQLSYHNGKTAINLTTNPNTTRKIRRVPRTTKYMSMETPARRVMPVGGAQRPRPIPAQARQLYNAGLVQVPRAQMAMAMPIPAPAPIVIPAPVLAPAPILLRQGLDRVGAVRRIQRLFRNKRNYTRAELDAMSIEQIARLLKYSPDRTTIIAPIRGITSQRDRDIFNAYQRKINRRDRAAMLAV